MEGLRSLLYKWCTKASMESFEECVNLCMTVIGFNLDFAGGKENHSDRVLDVWMQTIVLTVKSIISSPGVSCSWI